MKRENISPAVPKLKLKMKRTGNFANTNKKSANGLHRLNQSFDNSFIKQGSLNHSNNLVLDESGSGQ
jgi:hypothetical protein